MVKLSRRALVLGTASIAFLNVSASASERLPVVASFSILGDVTREIGADRIDLSVLVGPDGDAHVFQPRPADGKSVARAKLIIVNGLNFEGWMDRLLKSANATGAVVTAAEGVKPRDMPEEAGDDHDQEAGDHAHGDPHAWQSVGNVKLYAANIRDGLIAADPAGKSHYEANAAVYIARLASLEAEIKAAIAAVPENRRRVITSHNSFGYFADAYGMAFVAPQGVSTEAEVSAKGVARIIRQVRKEKIPAIFMENISDPRLIQRISEETGARIGGTLFSDSLSDDKGPAATYIDMMRHNLRQLTAALSS
jgi:zinc/manganese transport system substrate-binding protein